MKKKEVQELPIRSFNNSNNEKAKFKIEIFQSFEQEQIIKIEAHRHDYYHILFIKNGIGKHYIDFKTYDVKPNSIFFVSPSQVHSLEVSADVDGYVITFNSDFFLLNNSIQKLLDYPFFHSVSNIPVIYLPEKNPKIQLLLNEIHEEYEASEKGRVSILRALLEVFLIKVSRLYHQPTINQSPNYLSYQVQKLEALIETHFKDYKKLNDYAEMMFISPQHLNNLCKKGLNKTVTNLIHERTLIEAKRLLLFTNNSITEIAYELGFKEKSYFMRFFKKHTTLTADTYRKQNNFL